jgi:hypothetical protein
MKIFRDWPACEIREQCVVLGHALARSSALGRQTNQISPTRLDRVRNIAACKRPGVKLEGEAPTDTHPKTHCAGLEPRPSHVLDPCPCSAELTLLVVTLL